VRTLDSPQMLSIPPNDFEFTNVVVLSVTDIDLDIKTLDK